MPRRGLVCLTIVAAFQAHLATAGDVSQDVPVPGGTAAMAESLGLASPPDRPRFVAELARLTYPAAESTQTTRAKTLNAWRASRGKPQESQPTEMVPIPLNVTVWSQAVFHRAVAAEDIVAAILSDPRSAHLCYGLAASDDETLQFFVDHPTLLTWLHENAAAVFAAFGGSLHIRGNRVVVPGPPGSEQVWGSVIHDSLDRPEAFVRALYGQDLGRLAYLYDTISELDLPHAAFALGFQKKDSAERLTRFKALASVNRTVLPQWQPAKFPFARPPFDLANLLGRVRVDSGGSPSFPATRSLWSWIFDGLDAPADSPRVPLHAPDEPVDAAWLAQAIVVEDFGVRSDRLDQLAFGQRAFVGADAAALPDALVAIRAFPRSRMLMLTLERIGVTQPSVYAVAARRAHQLSTLEGRRQLIALQQFQGALVLVARLALVKTIDVAVCERLVVSLSTLAPNSEGRYAGLVATWLDRDLRAALIAADVRLESPHVDDPRRVRLTPQDDVEPALVAALAGSRGDLRRTGVDDITWEGQVYRLDLVATQVRRLLRVREKQGSPRIDWGLSLAAVARRLTANRVTSEEVTAAGEDLTKIASEMTPRPDSPLSNETIAHAVAELSKIGPRPDAHRLAQIAGPLADFADEVLGDLLTGWAYALSIPDADSPILLTGSVTRRHDFGLTPGPRRARSSGDWALPRQKIAVGVPWHVGGSLLGLDVALSSQALRRVDGNRVVDAPSLSTNEREAFAEAVALLDPLRLSEQERDVIVEAIAKGRRRIASLSEDAAAFTTIAEEIRMDGWRQRAVRWTMTHEPGRTETFFSLTEILHLGGAPGLDLDPWGMSGIASAGCLCTRMAPPNQWRTLIGRPQFGLMASTVPDLNLHIVSILRDLHLPAAISKAVLTAAVQDFIDEVRPTDANDWLTLVRMARTAPRERIEDYVAAATADGPLVPAVSEPVQ